MKLGQDATRDQPQGEGNKRQGRGADNSQAKDKRKETPPHSERHTTAKQKDTAKAQAETPAQQKHHKKEPNTRGSETQDQGQKTAGRARPKPKNVQNQPNKNGGQEGTGPHGGPQKDPHHTASKREQITTRCPGTKGTGDQKQKARQQNRRERRRRGEGRYVKLRVDIQGNVV